MDEETIETTMLSKMPELANNISVCYVSDRNKDKYHIIPGE
jgi:hypothetical protein